jgi:hypothetical protein
MKEDTMVRILLVNVYLYSMFHKLCVSCICQCNLKLNHQSTVLKIHYIK